MHLLVQPVLVAFYNQIRFCHLANMVSQLVLAIYVWARSLDSGTRTDAAIFDLQKLLILFLINGKTSIVWHRLWKFAMD